MTRSKVKGNLEVKGVKGVKDVCLSLDNSLKILAITIVFNSLNSPK